MLSIRVVPAWAPLACALLLGCRTAVPIAVQSPRIPGAASQLPQPMCVLDYQHHAELKLAPGDRPYVGMWPSAGGDHHLELLRDFPLARVRSENMGLRLQGFIEAEDLRLSVKQPVLLGGYLLTQGPLRLVAAHAADRVEVELAVELPLVQPQTTLRAMVSCAELSTDLTLAKTPALPDSLQPHPGNRTTPEPWYLWGTLEPRTLLVEQWGQPVDRVRDVRWARTHLVEVPLSLAPAAPPVAMLRGKVHEVEVLKTRQGFSLVALKQEHALVYGWVPEQQLRQLDTPLPDTPLSEPPPYTRLKEAALSDKPQHLSIASPPLFFPSARRNRQVGAPHEPGDPMIEFGPAAGQGPLSTAPYRLTTAILPAMEELLKCYQAERRRSSTFEAQVLIELVIATTGQVHTSQVKSSTRSDTDVAQCIAQAVLRSAQFPGLGEPSTIVCPFVMKMYDRPRFLRSWTCSTDVDISLRFDGRVQSAGSLRAGTIFEAELAPGSAMIPFHAWHAAIDLAPERELVISAATLARCRRLSDAVAF